MFDFNMYRKALRSKALTLPKLMFGDGAQKRVVFSCTDKGDLVIKNATYINTLDKKERRKLMAFLKEVYE